MFGIKFGRGESLKNVEKLVMRSMSWKKFDFLDLKCFIMFHFTNFCCICTVIVDWIKYFIEYVWICIRDTFRDHSFSTYAKFFEKLKFLAPWYAYIRGGKKC